jgi:hypothetical protein
MVLERRNSILFTIILVSLISTTLNVSAAPTLLTSTLAADDKDCNNNDGGNNCNDTKKSASPELECKHQIKDNKDSAAASKCTNNSQILIDSNIDESSSDGDTSPELRPNITLIPASGQVDTLVQITGVNFHVEDIVSITFNDISIATTPAIVTTSPQGEFSASFKVPGDATEGLNTVTAIDSESGQASAGFNVEVP